jgi:TonB family protein
MKRENQSTENTKFEYMSGNAVSKGIPVNYDNKQLNNTIMKTIKILALAAILGLMTMNVSAQQPQKSGVKAGYGVPVAQTEPEFPGGPEALAVFLHENLKYPPQLRDSRTGGKVMIMFIIDKDGKVIDPVVLNGINDPINEEALRVVKLMPNWKPGTTGGMPVNKQFILPIEFVAPSI